jgi:hypothetical protein
MLSDKLLAAESQMKAKLQEARATFAHRGNKGDHVEAAFRAFLQEYLARRHFVGHGEVVDTKGNRSTQTDVVITSEDHPFTFTTDEPGLFFVEGVCAAGEVKSVLTTDLLKSTIDNSRAWKRLQIEMGNGTMVHAHPADLKRYYKCPPYFLFAMESRLALETVHERLATSGSFGRSPLGDILDGVFLLDRGWIIDFGMGTGSFQYLSAEHTPLTGWQPGPCDRVLFEFLAWLSACMPKMRRFEPVLLAYLRQGFRLHQIG